MSVLKNRSLLILAVSESVTNLGAWVTMMAVFSLVIFRGEGDVSESGLIYLAGLLPALAFSPVAGWLCDRYDRKKLMIASELLSGVVVAGIIFTRSTTLLYMLLALQAAVGSLMTPARQSSVPQLVDREQLTKANALLQQISSVVKIFGPVLGGAVLAVMEPHTAVILDVVSYFLSAAILLLLPALVPPAQEKTNSTTSSSEKWYAPLLELARLDRQVKLLFVMAFMAIVGIVSIDILASIFTRDVLNAGESFYGLEIGLVGLGTLLGAAALMFSKKASRPWVDVTGGLALMSVLPAAMAAGYLMSNLTLVRILVVPTCLLCGYGMGRKMVQDSTLLQTLAPTSLLGRVSGLYQGTITAAQLVGTLLTTALVPAMFSTRDYFGMVTLLILAVAGFAAFYLFRSGHLHQVGVTPAGD